MKKIEFTNIEALRSNLGRKLNKKEWPVDQLKNLLMLNKEHRNLPILLETVTEVSRLPHGFGMINHEFAFKVSPSNDGTTIVVYLYKLDPLLLAKKREQGIFLINLVNPDENTSYNFQIARDENHGGFYLESFLNCPVHLHQRQLIYQCTYLHTEFNLTGIRLHIIGINGLSNNGQTFKMKFAVSNPTLETITQDLLKQRNIHNYTDFLSASQNAALQYLSDNGGIGSGVSCWFE